MGRSSEQPSILEIKVLLVILLLLSMLMLFLVRSTALNLSKEIGFQEGFCGASLLKIVTLEKIGDIRAAFQLAVFLKTLDLKVILENNILVIIYFINLTIIIFLSTYIAIFQKLAVFLIDQRR